jgi:hypothetical protein
MDKFEIVEKLVAKLEANKDIIARRYNFYYYGSAEGEWKKVITNMIFGTVNQFLSLVYSGDNIILEPRINDEYEHTDVKQFIVEVTSRLANTLVEDFKNNKSEIVLDQIVLDGLIYKTGFGKIIYSLTDEWKTPYIIRLNPLNIAVGYPSFEIQDRQQVFLHRTYITPQALETKYDIKLVKKVFDNIKRSKAEQERINDEALRQSILIAPTSMATGIIQTNSKPSEDKNPIDELIELYELWSFNYERNQWECNIISNEVVLSTTYHLVNPFFTITPFDYPSDKYGFSMIELLTRIQDRIEDIYTLLHDVSNLLANPPTIITGYQINQTNKKEIVNTLKTPGDAYIIDGNSVRVEPYNVKLDPSVALREKETLESDSQKIMSMTSIMQGVPASNVRSASYAQILSQFSAAPMKKVALRIEKQIEDFFNLLADIYINGSTVKYLTSDGKSYTFSNLKLSNWGRVVVYANSSSPIIKESNENLLLQLAEAGIIPKDILVDVLTIPYKDKVKEYIAKKEQEKAIESAVHHESQQANLKKEHKK